MKHTRVHAPKAKTANQRFLRYARAAVLADPRLVHKLAPKLYRPIVRRPSNLGK